MNSIFFLHSYIHIKSNSLGACAIWLVFDEFACSDLPQIVLEIMQLPIHIVIVSVYDVILDSWML